METRLGRARKAYRTQLLGLPTELVLRCLSFCDPDELLPVTLTSKALRTSIEQAAATILYHEIVIDAELLEDLGLLRARALDRCVAPYSRGLEVTTEDPEEPPEQIDHIISPLLLALKNMTGLKTLFVAPWLLTDQVIEAVRSNSSIDSIEVNGPITPRTLPPFLHSPPSSSIPRRSLSFALIPHSSSELDLVNFISPITRGGDLVEDLETSFYPILFAAPELLPSLRFLALELDPDAGTVAFPWIRSITNHHPSVTKITVTVSRPNWDPFFLSNDSNNFCDAPVWGELVREWSQTGVNELVSKSIIEAGRPIFASFKLVLPRSIISRAMVVSLARVVGSVTKLTIGAWVPRNGISWEDWGGTVSAFKSFTSLSLLTLGCSVTPTSTLTSVVGCGNPCIELACQHDPTLRTNLSLLSGVDGLRSLFLQINLQRLELLAPHLPVSTTVNWILGNKEEPIASYVGVVEGHEGGKNTLPLREGATPAVASWSKLHMRPACLVCEEGFGYPGNLGRTTPVDALVDCSVAELRKAMAIEGILEVFDRRILTGDATPLELFVRPGVVDEQL